jgi:multidrug efflux pump subunit AcrA (membrane-fusion protein)
VLAIACVVVAACHETGGERPAVTTAVVRRAALVDRVVLTGMVHATAAVELVVPRTSENTLTIRWLAEDGSHVAAGERIAELDSAPFAGKLEDNRNKLRNAEAQFQLAEVAAAAKLAGLRSAVHAQQIARDKAKLVAEVPADVQTARVTQDNRLKLTQAEIELGKAQSALSAAIAQSALERKEKQIELERTKRWIAAAEQAIGELVITAPRDGVVVIGELVAESRKFHVGDTAYMTTVIATLPDLTRPMEIRADMIDVDDGRIGLAMTGTCTPDAYPDEPIACPVEAIAPVARAQEGRDTVRRSFSVTLALTGTTRRPLLPGMSFKVELHRQPLQALAVPRAAVIDGAVRLASGERRDVVLGPCDAQQCAVAKGLDDGDAVVLGGAP